MSSTNTGGAAFPDPGRTQSAKQRESLNETRMSLRDYFAAKAMATLIAEDDDDIRWWLDDHGEGSMSTVALARASYNIADAMLAERVA